MSNYPNLYCEQMQDSTEVYYTFDENEGAVVVATYMILGRFNAGQLIQAWGTPTGFNRDGVAVTIYWPEGRYAYFADAEITPFSPVGFVSFSKRHLDYKPWHGFNNNQESSPNE